MNAEVRVFHGRGGHTEINLSISPNKADAVLEALRGMLASGKSMVHRMKKSGKGGYDFWCCSGWSECDGKA